MSARVEALRVPGKGSGHRSEWLALVAFLVAAALAMAVVLMTTHHTAVPSVRPATGAHVAKVAPVSGDGVRVGGTSVYRFHPLPETNVAFGSAVVAKAAPEGGPTVGGSGPYQHHPLP